ncbi:HNH endonuclease [Chryseobacterium carnipullorum]|uniref:HNH endonuclease n=1 Tax=Chryseobacterium carnipullorum TaxID=1124835 RepID=UPI00091A183A|nr:HNH endonuclease [Chryseobacterium carnipullorum]SHM84070.1 HNH endonuclease [Chryseobacterium carnipullorum]
MTKNDRHKDAEIFAEILRKTKLPNEITIGKFILKGTKGVKHKIQYNQDGFESLQNEHEYTFPILDGDLQVSLQLYENTSDFYRLFCYTKINGKEGMTFSVNLTTEKESDNVIYLTQKIKFSEQYKGSEKLAQAHRRQKQIVFCEQLKKLGFDVTDNNDIVLGIFDPTKKQLVNTSLEKFLNDFIVVSILKGHFQGNKGYQLEILPTYNKLDYIFTGKDDEIENLPLKVIENKTKRNIPLGMRYKVFKKDNFKCVACGKNANDGAKLHVDHKIPFSLGGLTELNNLQTLCSECNLSKSNKHID